MSLNWDWADKMGEVIYKDECYHPEHPYKTNIYQGNALMIWVNEMPDDTYSLANFAVDMKHMNNMLGLNAKGGYGDQNLFDDGQIKCIRLNTKYKSVPKIVEAFAKANTRITIELYREENKK